MSFWVSMKTGDIQTLHSECRERVADVYLVELSSLGLSVISATASSRKLTKGADLSDILDFTVSDALRKYLLAYGNRPVVIPTLVGSALILPQVFASSRIFGVVFFKKEKKGALLRIATSDTFEGRVGALGEAERGRIRKWDEPLAEDLNRVLCILDDILDRSEVSPLDGYEILEARLGSLFALLSDFTGVSVELDIDATAQAGEDFDRKLFAVFALVMLQLAHSHRASTVNVRIYQKSFGMTVAFSFKCAKQICRMSSREIAHFNAISDANNMIFECISGDGGVEIAFTPCRKDWSLLELKFPDDIIL